MSEQRIEAVARSDAPPGAVWELLSDATSWASWGPWEAVEVEREGAQDPRGVGAVKVIRSGRRTLREEIVAFEPPRLLAYRLLSGMPVRDYRADVALAPDGEGTRIEWRSRFRARLPGTGGLIRRRLAVVVQDVAERLARAAESR